MENYQDSFAARQAEAQSSLERAQKMQEYRAPQAPGMVGRVYVGTHPLQHMAEMLRVYQGGKAEKEARLALGGISAERNKAITDALRGFSTNMAGAPEQRTPMQADAFDEADRASLGGNQNLTAVTPERKPDAMAAYTSLLASPDAAMRTAGMTGMARIPELEAAQQERVEARAFRQQEAEAARAQRMQELQMRMEDNARSQQERLAAQKELRQMMIDSQKQTQQMILANRPERQAQIIQTEQGPMQFIGGQAVPIIGPGGVPVKGSAAGEKPLNESQANAAMYGLRMTEADKVLRNLEGKGVKDTGKIATGVAGTVGAIPLIGESLRGGAENVFNVLPSALGGLSEEQQQTKQARTNFITAVLRKESGASISPTEFATAEKNYFPAAGDSPAVIAQKQAARQQALQGMGMAAGPGAKAFAPAQTSAPTTSGW